MEPNINAAIKRGFLQQVRFLIEYGHSINERDEDLRTPLINCAFIDDENWGVGIARLFVEKGASIALRDKLGLNALHYACLHGRTQLTSLYLNAIDFNIHAVDKYGNTALHYASGAGNVNTAHEVINTCIKYRRSLDKQNKKGETALILAYKGGHISTGRLLISGGADEEIKDNEGKTAQDWLEVFNRRASVDNKIDSSQIQTRGFRAQSARNQRPRTALANIQVSSIPYRNQSRPTTAIATNRRKSSTYSKENASDDTDTIPLTVRRASASTYQPASVNDLRNNPQYVFQMSPSEFFTNNEKQGSFPFSSRCGSATRHNRQKEDPVNSSWRMALKAYFSTFDYQFAHSYRRTAVPPEPEPEELSEERPESPAPSELDSEFGGRKGGKGKDKHRKVSQSEKHDDKKGVGRKVSSLAAPSRQELGMVDSSSTESINVKRAERIKSAKPGGRDGNVSRSGYVKK